MQRDEVVARIALLDADDLICVDVAATNELRDKVESPAHISAGEVVDQGHERLISNEVVLENLQEELETFAVHADTTADRPGVSTTT